MYSSTYLNWFRRLLILGAAVAGLAASAAGVQAYPAPDPATTALERHFQHEDALYGLKSTPSLPGIAPTWEQAMAQHTTPALSPGDRIDLIVSQERGQAQSTLVSRPPDVSDAAQVAASVSTVHGNGFAWDDWAIGIGTGLGLALLLGGGIMVGRQQRHRVRPA
jgi:hypothetical protein